MRWEGLGNLAWVGRCIQPALVRLWFEDHRHPIMDVCHKLVRARREDGEGLDPLARDRLLPVLPYAGQTEGAAVLHCNGVGLLRLRAQDRPPLEEAIDRHDAAPPRIGVAEHRELG